jgi:hypothetical protein
MSGWCGQLTPAEIEAVVRDSVGQEETLHIETRMAGERNLVIKVAKDPPLTDDPRVPSYRRMESNASD